jgi:hypothetical protein
MNANELADELKYITKVLNMNTDMDTKPLVESATMLRQQQAEIELLNAKLAYMFEQEIKSAILRKAQDK